MSIPDSIDELEEQIRDLEQASPDSLELADCLERCAVLLRKEKTRLLDAANMEARAQVIRSKHGHTEPQAKPSIGKAVEGHPEPRPRNVMVAVNVLWATVAILLAQSLILTGLASSMQLIDPDPLGKYFNLIFWLAIYAFIVVKISAGKNWARITLAVVTVLALFQFPVEISQNMVHYQMPPRTMSGYGEISVVPLNTMMQYLSIGFMLRIGLKTYALFLLFTKPGSAWFEKGRAENGQPEDDLMECPFCAETIKKKAKLCKHCRSTLRTE